ncbi:MAG: 6-bladed beta-propeller [candidate division KSB1 bacterium]|nr:6-bladed beta-propeller [candidate division KSB1 bacterium]MDQ7065780.1 6-bladed beta-propeller [candidate division KSB1 bacterium]
MQKRRDKMQNPSLSSKIISILSVFLLLAFAGLLLQNFFLKKKVRDLETASYVYKAGELAKITKKAYPKARIIVNKEPGLWDRTGEKKVELVKELEIGGKDEDPNYRFYRPGPVIADNDGNIYVAETSEGVIRKYDKHGKFLLGFGGKGSGPGEFAGKNIVYFYDKNSQLIYVYDYGTQRVSQFNRRGDFVGSIQINLDIVPYAFSMDSNGYFYFSYYKRSNNKVIHKYDDHGTLVSSFAEPVHYPHQMRYIEFSIMRKVSPGALFIADSLLYFSRANPYEILIFSIDGKLKQAIYTYKSIIKPAQYKILGKNHYRHIPPAESTLIGTWHDKIINWIFIPGFVSKARQSMMDIFDLNGNLLSRLLINERIWASFMDASGRIYGLKQTSEGAVRIVVFSLKLKSI